MTCFTWWGKCHREFLGESSSIADPGQNAVDMFVTVFKSRITALFVWGKGKRCKYWCAEALRSKHHTIWYYMLLSIVLTLRTPSAAVPERYSCIHHGTCLRRSLEAFGGPVGNMRAYRSTGESWWASQSVGKGWGLTGWLMMRTQLNWWVTCVPCRYTWYKHPREVFPKICRCQGCQQIKLSVVEVLRGNNCNSCFCHLMLHDPSICGCFNPQVARQEGIPVDPFVCAAWPWNQVRDDFSWLELEWHFRNTSLIYVCCLLLS